MQAMKRRTAVNAVLTRHVAQELIDNDYYLDLTLISVEARPCQDGVIFRRTFIQDVSGKYFRLSYKMKKGDDNETVTTLWLKEVFPTEVKVTTFRTKSEINASQTK